MSKGTLLAAAVLAVCAAAACMPEPPAYDLTPPTISTVEPANGATAVPLIAAARLVFSEPLDPTWVTPAFFVVTPAAELDEGFFSDLNSSGLGSTRLDDAAKVTVTLDASGTVVTLTPEAEAPLLPNTEYGLVVSADVRDLARNRLTGGDPELEAFIVRFTTEGPGPVATVVSPESGAVEIPLNFSAIRVSFSKRVQNVDGSTFLLEAANGDEIAGRVTVGPDGLTAERTIDEQLEPATTYVVVLTEQIRDEAGHALPPVRSTFGTARCADTTRPTLTDGAASPRDTTILVTWITDEPSDSIVTVEALGSCAGAPTSASGSMSCAQPYDPCANPPTPANCTHRVVVSGLCAQQSFRLTPRSADPAGNSITGTPLEVTTTAPLARPVITEVLADPSTSPQEAGEFIELVNDSDVAWDFAGWQMVKKTASSETKKTIVRLDGGTDPLAPRAVALFTARAFPPASVPAGVMQLVESTAGTTLLGGLSSEGPTLELRDAAGLTVAAWPGGVKCGKGKSAERYELGGPDEAAAIGCTVVPTPGVVPGG